MTPPPPPQAASEVAITAMMARRNGCVWRRVVESAVRAIDKAGLFTLRSWAGTPQYGKMRASERCQEIGIDLDGPAGKARQRAGCACGYIA